MSDAFGERSRKAVGPDRPTYFGPGDNDRIMAVVLALASEVASLRERVDTHERIAAVGEVATPERVEAYRATTDAEAERETWRDAYIRRLFRVITEDAETLDDSPAK